MITANDAILIGNTIRVAAEAEIAMAYHLGDLPHVSVAERVIGTRGMAYRAVRDMYYLLPDKTRAQFNYNEWEYINAIGMNHRTWDPGPALTGSVQPGVPAF